MVLFLLFGLVWESSMRQGALGLLSMLRCGQEMAILVLEIPVEAGDQFEVEAFR
jgi:hypothetical protein